MDTPSFRNQLKDLPAEQFAKALDSLKIRKRF